MSVRCLRTTFQTGHVSCSGAKQRRAQGPLRTTRRGCHRVAHFVVRRKMPWLPSPERIYYPIISSHSAAIPKKVAHSVVRKLLLLFSQVFYKVKGLIKKLLCDLISFKRNSFVKGTLSYGVY